MISFDQDSKNGGFCCHAMLLGLNTTTSKSTRACRTDARFWPRYLRYALFAARPRQAAPSPHGRHRPQRFHPGQPTVDILVALLGEPQAHRHTARLRFLPYTQWMLMVSMLGSARHSRIQASIRRACSGKKGRNGNALPLQICTHFRSAQRSRRRASQPNNAPTRQTKRFRALQGMSMNVTCSHRANPGFSQTW